MRQLSLCIAASIIIAMTDNAAEAKCTRLAFSVNHYGKEGPTNDAKALLDKYIATWTAKNDVKTYSTGPKDVKCELFLDFGLFDEYTCRAEANVCWGGSIPAGTERAITTPAK